MLIVLVLAFLAAGAPALGQTPSHERVNRVLADAVILPVHQQWADRAAELAPAVEALCAEPKAAGLQRAQAAFHDVMDAWQAVQPVAIGPVAQGDRRAVVQFWPDKHGTATRQLNQALAEQDPKVLEDLATQSVALQNLQALEVLLFGVDLLGQTPKAAYACALAASIGRRQGELAAVVLADWHGKDGFHAAFTSAAGGNDRYFDAAEAGIELFQAMLQSLDVIIALKLERPLGDSLEDAKPRLAESWRSERSLRNIEQNLATIEVLYATPGGLRVWLEGSQPGLHERLVEVLASTRAAADAVAAPLEDAVSDPGSRAKLEQLLAQLQTLRILMRGTLADAAGITIGFNAMDGD